NLREVAAGMGMGWANRLFRVELPLALPVIFAGVRVSVVNAIGMVTLASLVAAGGLGDVIFRGISIMSWNMIVCGSVPVLVLALVADGLLKLAERYLGGRWAAVAP
ncbi:MAG: transporter permease subunit, partial [Gammaproteobacteria bacterium]|nr:transporter permease subunit [Gammaproteobacteria bacterium]